jgi:CubicO group peptidase (beta-lactamase class C family)
MAFFGTTMTQTEHALAGESRLDKGLDTIVSGVIEGSPELAGLQVVVLRNGEVVYEYAGGFARRTEQGEIALTADHKVRVASISKLVVAIGLMRLVESGAVDLDADISRYLGFTLRNPNFAETPITLRMVLSHTSSIRDGGRYWLEAGSRFETFFLPGQEFYDDGVHFASGEGQEPGAYFAYSNLNFGIVAAVIERVSGQRFDRFMRKQVLQPLGLEASYNVCDLSATQPDTMATLWRRGVGGEIWRPDEDWVPQLDHEQLYCHYGREPVGRGEDPGEILPGYTMGENPTLFSPQGGLRASARDLSVIGRMLLDGGRYGDKRILEEQTVRDMFTSHWRYDPALKNGELQENPDPADPEPAPTFTEFGLSVHVADLQEWGLTENARTVYGHLGEAYGLLGLFWVDPKNGDGLFALITGLGDDPAKHPGESPLHRPEEEIMRWWLTNWPSK